MLWTTLCLVPHELVGSEVLPFLSCKDVVRWDEAVLGRKSRQTMRRILHLSRSFELTDKVSGNKAAWKWFWDRNASLTRINVGGRRDDVEFLSKNAADKCCEIHLNLDAIGDIDAISNTLCETQLAKRVRLLIVFNSGAPVAVTGDGERLSNLEHLSIYKCAWLDSHLIWLEQCLRSNRTLKRLEFIDVPIFTPALISTFSCFGPSLTELIFSGGPLNAAALIATGQFCRALESLVIYGNQAQFGTNPDPPTATALVTIALGCRSLTSVNVDMFCRTGMVTEAFASHCTALRSLNLRACALTGTALRALSTHCPYLTVLVAIWAVATVEDVHLAEAALGRLASLRLSVDVVATTAVTLTAAVRLLQCAQDLALMLNSYIDSHLLQAILHSGCNYRSLLFGGYVHAAAVHEDVIALVRANPNLCDFKMAGLSDATYLELSLLLPNLTQLGDHHTGPGMSDALLEAYAQHCPLLSHLWESFAGPHTTDRAVLALAAHCPHLYIVCLNYSPLITEAALVSLVAGCPDLKLLHVASSISEEAVARIKAAKIAMWGAKADILVTIGEV